MRARNCGGRASPRDRAVGLKRQEAEMGQIRCHNMSCFRRYLPDHFGRERAGLSPAERKSVNVSRRVDHRATYNTGVFVCHPPPTLAQMRGRPRARGGTIRGGQCQARSVFSSLGCVWGRLRLPLPPATRDPSRRRSCPPVDLCLTGIPRVQSE